MKKEQDKDVDLVNQFKNSSADVKAGRIKKCEEKSKGNRCQV